ncbi:hypothetical protein EBU71_03885 [bacterium]|nr:hypothetical protein [Candidatus Elulimicrobium humile]
MPRYFADMYRNKSKHRHDQMSEWDQFDKDMKILTGMLYTIVKPLRPFFPYRPKNQKIKNEVLNNDKPNT